MKEVKGFKYKVSDNGNIIRTDTNRTLKPNLVRGYHQVKLSKDSKDYCKYVHRLVAEAYIPNPNNYPEVNHIDEDKTNNHASNLEWCTHQQNKRHSSKLDESKVQALREACAAGYKRKDIAKYFNISTGHLGNVVNGVYW